MIPRLKAAVLALVVGGMVHANARAASGLRLRPMRSGEDGRLALSVSDEAAGAVTAERSARIDLLTATEPVGAAEGWERIEGPRMLTNGVLRVEHAPAAGERRRFFVARENPAPREVLVHDAGGLRAAVAEAGAGTSILLAPGTYAGGFVFNRLRGAPGRPVVIRAADPTRPPVIQGGLSGIQLTDPEHVVLEGLTFTGATGNGLNIDDGGTFETPARRVVLRGLRVTDVGPAGNRDGIKMSGVVDFRVEGCTVERWGAGGSAVDLVGCHGGVIVSNVFRHTPAVAAESASGVQAKGGNRDLVIRRNRFEYAGSRAINIGGSTGLEFFRPPLLMGAEHWEAKDVRVEGNTFIGSLAPVAFVGVDGAEVRFNTFYRPQKWIVRILLENSTPGFVATRNGRFTDNLVVFHSSQWSAGGVNVGAGTAPATFEFSRNWWYCLDAPTRSRPTLPVAETAGIYGISPQLRDGEAGDLRLQPGSPASQVGADALPD